MGRVAGRGEHPGAVLDRQVDGGLAERGGRAADQQGLTGPQAEVSVQGAPGRRVHLGHCGQLGPGQLRADGQYVGRRHGHQFRVTAVACPAHAAEDRHHSGPGQEFARGVGFDQAGALDPRDGGHRAPGAAAHVRLGVVEAEGLDPDEYFAVGGYRIGQFCGGEHLGAAVGGDDNGPHVRTPFLSRHSTIRPTKGATARWPRL